jgi:hypothetical protein
VAASPSSTVVAGICGGDEIGAFVLATTVGSSLARGGADSALGG